MGCEHSLCRAELNLFVAHLLFCGLGSGVATSTFRSFYSGLSGEASTAVSLSCCCSTVQGSMGLL